MKLFRVPCTIMTRTVGYFSNVNQMNPGKRSEIKDRHQYHLEDVEKALKREIVIKGEEVRE